MALKALLLLAAFTPQALGFGPPLRPASRVGAANRPYYSCPMVSPPQRCLTTFAYNIFEDSPATESKYAGTEKAVAEQIFNQHKGADINVLEPGAPFAAACFSLASEYPELQGIKDPALEGRAFALFDLDGDGTIDLEEFITGVTELRSSTSTRYKALQSRLAEGRLSDAQSDFSGVKKVAIVGAGVAGLQTAKALKELGLDVTVLEKSDNVGGVWRKNYADFGLQVPQSLYEFPDFPYPKGNKYDRFPKGAEVQDYIEQYATANNLRALTRFETGVQKISSNADGLSWTLETETKGERKTEVFDFVVVATGMYGWPPHIPLARGSDKFKGEILHSCTFTDKEVAKDKDVLVVGAGKSAVDNAVAAAKTGKSSTLLFRNAHWPVPRNLLNLLPFKWGTYSRFGHFMLPAHYKMPAAMKYLHALLQPIKWVWWRVVEWMFRIQFGLRGDLIPKTPIEIDLFTGGQILTYEFSKMLRKKTVAAKKASIDRYTETGVVLTDGTEMPADLVIYGTGFKKNYDIFDSLVQRRLEIDKDGLYLYRNVIPPGVANIAFVGSEVSTFNNILTHSMQAQWLKRVLRGDIVLPSPGMMRKEMETEQAWKRTWMPPTSARSSIWQLHMMKYHDTLCEDMGESKFRKGLNFLGELFAPYSARDYRKICS